MVTKKKCGEVMVTIYPLAGEPGRGPWVVLSDDHGPFWRDHLDEMLAGLKKSSLIRRDEIVSVLRAYRDEVEP